MVRIPAGIYKKTKHTNLETDANAAYVNKGTCYWAFTVDYSSLTVKKTIAYVLTVERLQKYNY